MQKFLFAGVLLIASFGSAQTLKTYAGQTFTGKTYVNEKATGQTCHVIVNQVAAKSTFGNHCYDLEATFGFDNSQSPAVVLASRVTNAHRAEYPQFKSCAASLNGLTSEQDIYNISAEDLYTPFFAAEEKVGSKQYDYFLTIDPVTKLPTRARVHVMTWFTENNYDCLNLTAKTVKAPAEPEVPAEVPAVTPPAVEPPVTAAD